MATHLRKNDFAITPSTRKNMRRNIEKCFGDKLKIFTWKEKIYLYSAEIDAQNLVKQLLEAREKCIYTVKTAQAIHKEIKDLKDEMPWPPQPNDLQPENFKTPKMLSEFLTTLITGKDGNDEMSSRQARLTHSIAQDIVYIVSNGKVKTPKSLLLPSIIKQLTNNTEIINILHRLGHSVSYSILNEMHTENAYIIHDKQENDDIILPLTSEKETFTIYVADNIDRNEETLSGKLIYLNQFADKRFIFISYLYKKYRSFICF